MGREWPWGDSHSKSSLGEDFHFRFWPSPRALGGHQGSGVWGGSMVPERRVSPQQMMLRSLDWLLSSGPQLCTLQTRFRMAATFLWHLPFSSIQRLIPLMVTLPRCLFGTYICWSSCPWPEPLSKALHDHQINPDLATRMRLKSHSCTNARPFAVRQHSVDAEITKCSNFWFLFHRISIFGVSV